jgi:GTP cyclohydrolase II
LAPKPCKADLEYDWKGVHADLENGIYAGSYGWDNAAYWGIAEQKAGIDLKEWYKTRTEAEFYLPEFKGLIDDPETQKDWANIVTFDPMGMYAHPPTIAACQARLDIPELHDLEVDGKIVLPSKEIVSSKCAVYYAWNIPALATRLDLSEDELRKALHKYSHDPKLLDPSVRTYIPAVGGCTIYTFGDPRKLRDPKTETVVRVHDECIGSDVFGSDICSCRPYLVFALQQAIQCAQRGGVGVVVYFRKEGRSLGEVIKFRVYNARINQDGGDRPEMYFHHTESIAGIRDARFQTMMPDVLNWLGIRRIDWLCSMSNEKYEAITGAGILVMQRVDLPEDYVKDSMKVELDAKIASGYHSDSIDKALIASEFMQLAAIRRQCSKLYDLAKAGQLVFFNVNEAKLQAAVDATEKSMRERYPSMKVLPHSRLRHFETEKLSSLLDSWKCDKVEKTRRLIDLVTVSVLLDAGAGPDWRFIAPGGEEMRSSEGLAMASWELFLTGFFSTDPAMKMRVNSQALKLVSDENLARGLQVSRSNPLLGVEGRARLLRNLGEALEANPEFFGSEVARPGNMVDYLLAKAEGNKVGLEHLWRVCQDGLNSIWPLQPNGIIRGDVWTHSALKTDTPGSDLVPFHKLTQWLVYSLIDAMQHVLGLEVTGTSALTCLPEYRNGGLLIDAGVLSLKDPTWLSQEVNVGTELIVEWRALTIVLIDKLAEELRKRVSMSADDLPLAAVLEGGTWHAGRALARQARSDGSAPIRIRLDGTVF